MITCIYNNGYEDRLTIGKNYKVIYNCELFIEKQIVSIIDDLGMELKVNLNRFDYKMSLFVFGVLLGKEYMTSNHFIIGEEYSVKEFILIKESYKEYLTNVNTQAPRVISIINVIKCKVDELEEKEYQGKI